MAHENWSDAATRELLTRWRNGLHEYKRQKMAFYEATARALGDTVNKNGKSIKNRCEFLDRKYVATKRKLAAAGTSGGATCAESHTPALRAAVMKQFKWYYEMDALLGDGRGGGGGGATATAGATPSATPSATTATTNASSTPRALRTVMRAERVRRTPPVTATTPRAAPTDHANPRRVVRSLLPAPDRAITSASAVDRHSNAPAPALVEAIIGVDEADGRGRVAASATTHQENTETGPPAPDAGTATSDTSDTRKRKQPEPTVADVLLHLGEQALAIERTRLEMLQKRFDVEMQQRRDEMQQRQRQFELTYQTKQAKYELDRIALEAKLRALGSGHAAP